MAKEYTDGRWSASSLEKIIQRSGRSMPYVHTLPKEYESRCNYSLVLITSCSYWVWEELHWRLQLIKISWRRSNDDQLDLSRLKKSAHH